MSDQALRLLAEAIAAAIWEAERERDLPSPALEAAGKAATGAAQPLPASEGERLPRGGSSGGAHGTEGR